MDIKLANPRGFCAGVDRAIDIVNRALELYGAPLYVRHEVVHNKFVVDDLRQRGAVFVDELDEVPDNQLVIFSAHGVSQAVRTEADKRGLKVFDATCPLVMPVRDESRLAYVTQTTLSMDDTARIIDALRARFPKIEGPRKDDICYATQNRQDAVKTLAAECDIVLVVGSPNSSNSNRLRELAERMGCEAYLLDDASQLQAKWFEGKQRIGVTAGASAPEILVTQVLDGLKAIGAEAPIELDGIPENITFSIPRELRMKDLG